MFKLIVAICGVFVISAGIADLGTPKQPSYEYSNSQNCYDAFC